ncbi:hypothetical protein NPIL_593171 [Nephila pilipes]|uniref:Uncharacterized protein n=1 Tax=Nephila pilipes TaxID=299642 RepID=A0A8X6MHR4_NEPPI|nr:hypothetical protein NPIL_593171 [Nephila pilipes]
MEKNSPHISFLSGSGMGGLLKFMSPEATPFFAQHKLVIEGGSIDQNTSFITIAHNNARNVCEKNMVTSPYYEHTSFRANSSAPIRVKLNGTINQPQGNIIATSSVERNSNTDTLATLECHTIYY